MSYLAIIDEGGCIAQGDCAELAPDSFTVGDAAQFHPGGNDARMLAAARACPVEAITIVDSETGEQIFP